MFEQLSPRTLATPQEGVEYLELHQMAQEFRLEADYRDRFEAYCQWYYRISLQNQQELAAMQSDPDGLGWFSQMIRPGR
ncbi:MAG: hypothetical protein HC922_05100 [Leptolyngbyaceae cyanobacterium SM2_3_12]|nr:hypothetical protein [Leptolyngbyaceae cyanobacterium SM2_3_12]